MKHALVHKSLKNWVGTSDVHPAASFPPIPPPCHAFGAGGTACPPCLFILATIVSAQIQKRGLSCLRLDKEMQLAATCENSGFHDTHCMRRHLWAEARTGPCCCSGALAPRQALLFPWPTHPLSSELLGRKKKIFWRCKLRSATVSQIHLTSENGSACLFKDYEMLYVVKSPLKQKMRILLIYLNGTLTGNLITRES